jgi:nicotinamide-nucleotide amidase
VRSETLQRIGAVSEQTARELALGALARSKGTISVAVTGVAGPSGGSATKPVGLVWFAWATNDGIKSESRNLAGDREAVRRESVQRALEGVLEALDAGLPRA